MKERNIFNFLCQKDINDIYSIINPYLPDLDLSRLNQSIIYEDYKKIVCRTIKNNSRDIIGKELIIQLYDNGEIYKLKHLENSIKLEKTLGEISEKIKIVFDDYSVKRFFTYKKDEKVYSIEEEYSLNSKDDLYNYVNADSIKDTMKKLKNKNKTRKRT